MNTNMPIVGLGIIGGAIVGLLVAPIVGAPVAVGIAVGASAGLVLAAVIELGVINGQAGPDGPEGERDGPTTTKAADHGP